MLKSLNTPKHNTEFSFNSSNHSTLKDTKWHGKVSQFMLSYRCNDTTGKDQITCIMLSVAWIILRTCECTNLRYLVFFNSI